MATVIWAESGLLLFTGIMSNYPKIYLSILYPAAIFCGRILPALCLGKGICCILGKGRICGVLRNADLFVGGVAKQWR